MNVQLLRGSPEAASVAQVRGHRRYKLRVVLSVMVDDALQRRRDGALIFPHRVKNAVNTKIVVVNGTIATPYRGS
jgi:hypothetical protein